jgi:hypothetical protein
METHCPDCGTENYEGSRFCRKCGRTLIDFAAAEATTRSLEERERAARMYAEAGDRPRYAPPSDATPPGGLAAPTGFQPAAGTNPLGGKPASWPLWLALSVALVVIMALSATLYFNRVQRASTPVVAPEAIPPPAEEEESTEEESTPAIDEGEAASEDELTAQIPDRAKKWIYPGSTADTIHELPGGQVAVELTSDDEFARVVKFYRDRMPNAIKETSRDEANFVGNEAIVQITDEGGSGTTIELLVHPPGGGPVIPPIPPIPQIPTPPAPPPPPTPRR